MRIHLTHPDLTDDLLRYLRGRIDVVADEVADGELLVGLLGSRSGPYQRRELEARLAGWRLANPHADVLVG